METASGVSTVAASTPATEDFAELDLTFAPKGAVVGTLMNSTSDNCGSTNESACAGCIAD